MLHRLVALYSETGQDSAGRSLDDVLRFSFDELEDMHDYIQQLFPLFETEWRESIPAGSERSWSD